MKYYIAAGLVAVLIIVVVTYRKSSGDLKSMTDGVRRSTVLTLYEGLPHPGHAEIFKSEMKSKKVVKFHDSPFYETPLSVDPKEFNALRDLCADIVSYQPYSGARKCGGFHPDYCLTWLDGQEKYEVHICFFCREMKLFCGSQEVYADIHQFSYVTFKNILQSRRGQRPLPQE